MKLRFSIKLGWLMCAFLACFRDRVGASADAGVSVTFDASATTADTVSESSPRPDLSNPGCEPRASIGCYIGPDGTRGIGICRPGTFMCRPDGTWSTTCEAQVTPVAEVLCNGLDDDCDGDVDEGDVLRCGMGACARTAPACTDGRSSQCLPGAPAPERCDGIDEDCDGVGDDDDPDATAACASTVTAPKSLSG